MVVKDDKPLMLKTTKTCSRAQMSDFRLPFPQSLVNHKEPKLAAVVAHHICKEMFKSKGSAMSIGSRTRGAFQSQG